MYRLPVWYVGDKELKNITYHMTSEDKKKYLP